jgi:hypothetical protein
MRAYVRSAAFLDAFIGLDPERRQTAMLLFAKAYAACEVKAEFPFR